MTTDSFKLMVNSSFHSDWMYLPVKLQKQIILVIGNTQKPFFFDGLGIMKLDLETYATVSSNNDLRNSAFE